MTIKPTEHHLPVTRRARYYALGDVARARELWVACHGYGQLAARWARHFAHIVTADRAVLVPEALNRFYLDDPRQQPGPHGPDSRVGATWMTREDREAEIADYVEYLDALVTWALEQRGEAPPPAVTILGFSQGAATAARWAVHGRARAWRLVLWGGRLPPELHPLPPDSPLRELEVVVVGGEQDRLTTAEVLEEQTASLVREGVRAELRRFGGGHTLDGATLRALAEGSAD